MEAENEEFTYRQIYEYIKMENTPSTQENYATSLLLKKCPSFKFKVQEMQVGKYLP